MKSIFFVLFAILSFINISAQTTVKSAIVKEGSNFMTRQVTIGDKKIATTFTATDQGLKVEGLYNPLNKSTLILTKKDVNGKVIGSKMYQGTNVNSDPKGEPQWIWILVGVVLVCFDYDVHLDAGLNVTGYTYSWDCGIMAGQSYEVTFQ